MPLPNIPAGIETKANQILGDLQTVLAPVQVNYLKANRGYWQGIRSHVVTPKDGGKSAPDKTRKPTDQKENWTDVAVTLPASMEITATVNVYDGPNGKGYEMVGEIEIGGRLWRRTVNVGLEKYRDGDWRDVTLEAVK